MISYTEHKKKLSSAQKQKIKKITKELIAEERSLREIRKARAMKQVELAAKLGINQGDLSKFERRTDVYLSSLRQYVEALGGTLELVVNFPDTGLVKIGRLGDLVDNDSDETLTDKDLASA